MYKIVENVKRENKKIKKITLQFTTNFKVVKWFQEFCIGFGKLFSNMLLLGLTIAQLLEALNIPFGHLIKTQHINGYC